MWAPFISLLATGEGTKLNEDYLKWLTGLGGARLDRCCGWTPIRDLDDKALVAAVRVFEDARKFQGLLGRAVQQLVVNWENTMGVRAPQKTWMGALLLKMNKVWPRFRVHIHSGISWTGAPLLRQETRFSLSRQFQEDLSVGKWQVRQSDLLNSRPRESQHDFFLFHLIQVLGSNRLRGKISSNEPILASETLESPIFPKLPTVNTESFRVLLRTLAGLEDYARVNSHAPTRRQIHPKLHNSTWDRSCLYCFFHHKQHFVDSEWHSFFECPLIHHPRREFLLLTRLESIFENGSSVENLALLIARVREDRRLLNALARFALQVREHREKWFWQLSSEAMKQRLARKLEMYFCI